MIDDDHYYLKIEPCETSIVPTSSSSKIHLKLCFGGKERYCRVRRQILPHGNPVDPVVVPGGTRCSLVLVLSINIKLYSAL